MSKKLTALVVGYIVVWAAVWIAILYVAAHFIVKYW